MGLCHTFARVHNRNCGAFSSRSDEKNVAEGFIPRINAAAIFTVA